MAEKKAAAAQWVRIEDLTPWAANPRANDAAVAEVAKSIERFGWGAVILARKDGGEIIAGHTRIKAAQSLGLESVPVRYLDISEDEAHALALADNKLSELADWSDGLASVLAGLDADGVDLDGLGWDADELAALLDAAAPDSTAPDDEVPDVQEDFDSEVGAVYDLGPHRLACGDSTDPAVWALLDAPPGSDLLSDPPYGMDLDTDYSTIKGSARSIGRKSKAAGKTYERVIGDAQPYDPRPILDFATGATEIMLFGADYYAERIPDRVGGSWLVWDKRKPSQANAIGAEFELIWSKRKHKRRVLRHEWFGFLSPDNTADARNRVHPTQKPVSLIVDMLDQWYPPAGPVLDPYGGSGSTLMACAYSGRTAYLIELDPRYCDVIRRRWTRWATANDIDPGPGALE